MGVLMLVLGCFPLTLCSFQHLKLLVVWLPLWICPLLIVIEAFFLRLDGGLSHLWSTHLLRGSCSYTHPPDTTVLQPETGVETTDSMLRLV